MLVEKYHFGHEEAHCISSLLEQMLVYDPSRRATACQCLDHEWLHHPVKGLFSLESAGIWAEIKKQTTAVRQNMWAEKYWYETLREDEGQEEVVVLLEPGCPIDWSPSV